MNGLLVGGIIGEGLKSFVNSYNATQDRVRQQAESDEDRAMRRQQLTEDAEYKKGMLSRQTKQDEISEALKRREQKFKEAQEGLEFDEMANTYKRVGQPSWQVKKDYDDKLIRARNKQGLLTPQQQYDTNKYTQASTIPGMQLRQGFRPPEKTVEELRAGKTTIDSLNSTIDKLDEAIGKYGTHILPGKENALLGTLITNAQLQLKEAQKLGVLNGPDLQLMIKQLGDPTSIRGAMQGPQALQMKLKQAKALLNKQYKLSAANAGFDVSGLPDFADPQIETGPKVGDIEDGHEYIGGDPKKKESWRPVNTRSAR